MRRLARHLLMFSSAASLLACVAVCGLWAVSAFRTDSVGWAGFDDRPAGTWHQWGMTSREGQLIFYRMQSGKYRLQGPPHNLNGTHVPDMRPHLFHHAFHRGAVAWPAKPLVYQDFSHSGLPPVGSPLRLRFVGVACWFAALLLAAGAVPAGRRLLKPALARLRAVPGCCRACGYDLRGTPERCPECGTIAAKEHT